MRVIIAEFGDHTNQTRFLKASCDRHGVQHVSYGMKERWYNWHEAKVEKHIPFLESIDDDIVFFSDGFDSLILKNKEAIMRAYRSFNSDIVIAANRSQYPAIHLKDDFDSLEHDSSFKYLCSGQYIGKREAIIEALKLVDGYCVKGSCQYGWSELFIRGGADIALDVNCKLFLTMAGVARDELQVVRRAGKENYRLRETGTYPCAIHYGGPKGGDPNGVAMYEFYKENGYV